MTLRYRNGDRDHRAPTEPKQPTSAARVRSGALRAIGMLAAFIATVLVMAAVLFITKRTPVPSVSVTSNITEPSTTGSGGDERSHPLIVR
jgi:hypothetical protein